MIASKGEKVFYTINNIFMIIFSAAIVYPFINIMAISFNDGRDAARGGIYLWPRKFSLAAYQTVFDSRSLGHSALTSLARTVLGTLTALAFTVVLAYILSYKELVFRRTIIFLFVFTMYFSGGLIPDYLLIKNLHLVNTFWVYIVPGLLGVWNVMIMRAFFEELPQSLLESARLDGCSELRILWKIVVPISAPILATVSLYIAVGQWSAWYDTYIYTNKGSLQTLQSVLVKILLESQANAMADGSSISNLIDQARKPTPEVIKMATIIITTVPVLAVYPFVQKYFIKGIMVGAVKE